MPPHLIVLFAVLPMTAGLVTLLLRRQRTLVRTVGVAALVLNVALAVWALTSVYHGVDAPAGYLVSQMGNWQAPFGISVVVDPLSAIMLVVSSLVCLSVFIYCMGQLPARLEAGLFHPTFHLLIMGVQWSFITGDLFNLFVAFEIMLMASYAMFVVGTTRAQMRHAYKYVLLNLVGSTMFVAATGLLYGQLGTLNMADITRMAMHGQIPDSAVPLMVLFVFVFGGKTAIFPLWYWLPETYPTLPAPIGGLFAGLLTKVGAYVMIRVFVMMFGQTEGVIDRVLPILLVSAGVTMFLGVLGAVSMHTVRRILAIHIISQVGYMILGIGLFTELAVAGTIFFVVHNMAVKCCLFLCAGLMHRHAGSDDLNKIGGLLRHAPWLATLFLIAALSLAGLPPLSGFFGKWILIHETFTQRQYALAGFAVATSVLTLLSMLKIWSYGFWSPPSGVHARFQHRHVNTASGLVGITILVVLALSMGLGAQQYFNVSIVASRAVMQPQGYVQAVLGPYARLPLTVQAPDDAADAHVDADADSNPDTAAAVLAEVPR